MSTTETQYETLQCRREGQHVLLVSMNRPAVFNAMNTQMGLDLVHLFEGFQTDAREVRCIVLTGTGEKAFCAGGDLKERNGMSDAQWQAQHAIFERAIRALMACPLPVVAAVNGVAFGGGCELACACTFIYASSQTRFALPEVTLGIMPGAGGTQNLPRAVGERRAMEIILTGKPFSAQQAEAWGLVNRILEPAELLAGALETAQTIAGNAPISVRQIKQSVSRGMQMSIWDGLMFEIESYNRMVPTQDRLEGVRAFNEKRKPNFKGC